MESVCQPCERNGFFYLFNKDQLPFKSGNQSCLDKGGSLASNLDAETYRMFHRCCPGGNQYWIGLFNQGNCPDDQYQWVTGEGSCASAEPLNVVSQPNNMNCQAIRIGLRTNDHGMSLPDGFVTDCTSASGYICQFQIPTTKAAPPETRFASTATSAIMMSSEKTTQFLPFSTTLLSHNELDTGYAAGIIVASALLFLCILALFVIKRDYLKKRCQRNESTEYPVKSIQEQNDQTTTKEMQDNILYNG